MTYLQFIGGSDEFSAIPKAYSGFQRNKIYGKGNDETDPAQHQVQLFEWHSREFTSFFPTKLIVSKMEYIFGVHQILLS